MSGFRFIDYPSATTKAAYQEAVDGIVARNCMLMGLKAIYRFGHITTPGISDLDLLFVFKEGERCLRNGLEALPDSQRNLFTHGIMALHEGHFLKNNFYTLWSDHELIWGDAPSGTSELRKPEEEQALRIQTAIEFLVANYIDLIVQRTYGTFKVRALLQHMKGIMYDLDYLGDSQTALHPMIATLKNWISGWFTAKPDEREIREWIENFIPEYIRYTSEKLQQHPLYLPESTHYTIARNMRLKKSDSLSYIHRGFLLPVFLYGAGRKYIKLQNRLNHFEFRCPIVHKTDEILIQRFRFLQEMKAYNKSFLPNFMTITTSITAKII